MRECGILLPVSSLPSRYGIGTFSKEAYEFVDQLSEAGQNYWQILPLGPTGYSNSPYQSFSSFAGSPYYIDLDQLVGNGLLSIEECEEADCGHDEEYIDYGMLYNTRLPILRKAYGRMKEKASSEEMTIAECIGEELCQETKEYCFYAALKDHFGGKNWIDWDEDIRLHEEDAVFRYQTLLADDIGFYEFMQLIFQKQWRELKDYAHSKGIRIIGDIPIYVAFDSADTWAHPELFQFDDKCRPVNVAGCPPDAFSATGQLWGNPLYNWDYHEQTDFGWWMRRIEYAFRLYDVLRIDHFRGFDEYYAIPASETTALVGTWNKGPGIRFFEKIRETFGDVHIIAEDLGMLTPSVHELRDAAGLPGMKVLQFAFSASEQSTYLPCFYDRNCVVYTGTHDNDTTRGWYAGLNEADRQLTIDYLDNGDSPEEKVTWDFIRLALSSVADLAVIPVQDYLNLGSEARINTPSTLEGNWTWRMKKGAFTPEIIKKCRDMNRLYGRGIGR